MISGRDRLVARPRSFSNMFKNEAAHAAPFVLEHVRRRTEICVTECVSDGGHAAHR